MRKVLIGYDIDGVLCRKMSPLWWKFLPAFVCNTIRLFARKRIRTIGVPVIVTGRPEADRFFTELWLKLHRVKYQQLFMTGDFSGINKCRIVKIRRLEVFFEDEAMIVRKLREIKDLVVIHVR